MRAIMVGLLLAPLTLGAPASAQPLEPPPEAPEGTDYVIEPADTLAEGDIELGVGAASRAGGAPARRRRVRFSGDDLSGAVREGSGDPLAGGSIDGRGGLGAFTAGRLAPRWGRGLLMGSAGDPWQREALDRGPTAAFRGRAGEGVMLRRGTEGGLDLLYGRFSRRRLAGASVRRGALTAGALYDGRSELQSSLAITRGAGDAELVWDRAGRWRAEVLMERALGRVINGDRSPAGPPGGSLGDSPVASPGGPPGGGHGGAPGGQHGGAREGPAGGWTASGRVRAGAGGFASLAERGRPGPARAMAAGLEGPVRGVRLRTLAALWRFRPGVTGARAGLAVERPLAHHGALAVGFEEQRGSRRDRGDATPFASSGPRADGMRQGWWGEGWGGTGGMALGVRHESWGERPWARAVVRSVTSARLEARGPLGLRLGVAHSVYKVRRGESLYLPEAESDRLVLRAVSGEGERTRIEARWPFAGGRVRAALHLNTAPDRRARPDWTLDWTRRARLRKSAGAPPE